MCVRQIAQRGPIENSYFPTDRLWVRARVFFRCGIELVTILARHLPVKTPVRYVSFRAAIE